MSEPYDPLFLENLRVTPEEMAAITAAKDGASRPVLRYGKQPKIKYMQFPTTLVETLIQQKAPWTALAVLAILYQEWYTHPNHYNPVVLTTYALRRFNVSRWQKYEALRVLEKTGQIYVLREKRKNPLVTLTWLPLKTPGYVCPEPHEV